MHRWISRITRAGLAGLMFAAWAASAAAQTILRDPDIEHALSRLATPMLNAAGLSPARVKVLLIHDSDLNAFVVDSRHIFIHSGLLLKLKTPEELQAVLAHEIAHIANGHITRRAANAGAARTAMGLGMALAVMAAAAGAGDAAAGLAIGTSSSAMRRFLSHTRAEEASADKAAVRYMLSAGIDPEGLVRVLDIFRGQEVLAASRQDPYLLSHPLSRDRLRAVRGLAAAGKGRIRPRPDDAVWFARARGKLEAFTRAPASVLRKTPSADKSLTAQMRRAIAWHRQARTAKAVVAINALTNAHPGDPFLHELKGQILLESRQFPAAARAYGRAAGLAPTDALILAGYGRALLALRTKDGNRQALKALQKAYSRDPFQPRMLRDLAQAYAFANQPGMASLMTAERYALMGRLKDAGVHAKRAAGLLPRGSSGWNRAQDILHAAGKAAK